MENRTTPDIIKKLKEGEIFVFGSNLSHILVQTYRKNLILLQKADIRNEKINNLIKDE